MAKKIALLAVLLAIGQSIFSQAFPVIIDYWFGEYYLYNNKKLYYINNSTGEKKVYDNYKFEENEYGYKYLTIDGIRHSYFPGYPMKEIDIITINNNELKLPYSNAGIKTIKESSALTETTGKGIVEYNAQNMLKRFVKEAENGFIWNDSALPWVEGAEGPGIGESLLITFDRPCDVIGLINGYVDFSRQYLYRQNNRAKRILLTSEEKGVKFSISYNLNDEIMLTEIILPQKTTRIKIQIEDCYKGTKHDDTCISAIIAYTKDERPNIDIKELLKNFK